jgi:asparagine synthase (glutamine-hydrolysing)
MFALAIWDETRQELFLARDRLGIKPLYYSWDGSTFLFASQLKAILQVPTVRRDLDPCALDDYLTYTYIPAPKTIFQGIRKLLPGHSLTVAATGLAHHAYWDLVMAPREPTSERDCAAELRDVLRQSVGRHLVSDVPVGAFLSGGVDSSSVVALMSETDGAPVATNSLGFSEPDFDELPFARLVAHRFQTRARELVLEPDAAMSIDALIPCFDEPFADSSMVPTFHLSRLARERSTVVLTGDGGDEQFAGYTRFVEFQREAMAGPGFAERSYFERRTWVTAGMKARLYRDWLKRALAGYDPFSVLEAYFSRARHWDPLSRIQYVETKTYLADDILTKVDRASMAHGLEARVPLLDQAVVEYAAGIPPRCKVRDGSGKYIFKNAVADLVPPEILTRPKMGFSMPLADWLRGPLRDLVEERALSDHGVLADLFDIGAARSWWEEHRRGTRDYNRFFWSLVVFEAWARRFLNGSDPPETHE